MVWISRVLLARHTWWEKEERWISLTVFLDLLKKLLSQTQRFLVVITPSKKALHLLEMLGSIYLVM
jgi:hypothetical protein